MERGLNVLADTVAVAYGDPETELVTMPRAELLENWRRGLEHTSSQHILTGVVVDISGDTAHATLNETAWMQADQSMGSPLYRFGTAMEAGLERCPEGWRIRRLRVIPLWSAGNAAVLGGWSAPSTSDRV